MNRIILSLLLSLCLVAALPSVAAATADDDYKAEYSAIYSGKMSDEDVQMAAKWLDAWHWTRTLLASNKSMTVRWYHALGEDPYHPGEWADNGDLLYWSTEGTSNDDPRETRQHVHVLNKYGTLLDSVHADQGDGGWSNPYITPLTWRDYPTMTYSKWDNDLEWVILAACNQLEHFYSSEDGAHEYAKALLGYPRRVHSMWGYHEYAPEAPEIVGYDTDSHIIMDFIVCENRSTGYLTIPRGWEYANEAWGIEHWSGIYHAGNWNETTWRPLYGSSGSTVLPDTSPYYTPNINFVYTNVAYTRDVL